MADDFDDLLLFPGYIDLLRRDAKHNDIDAMAEKQAIGTNEFHLKHPHFNPKVVAHDFFEQHFLHRHENHFAADVRHQHLMTINQPPVLDAQVYAEEHRLLDLDREIQSLEVCLLPSVLLLIFSKSERKSVRNACILF